MENLDISKTKSSLYCWIVLAFFIASTLAFMINFYQKTIDEITENSIILNNRIKLTEEI